MYLYPTLMLVVTSTDGLGEEETGFLDRAKPTPMPVAESLSCLSFPSLLPFPSKND
jgi:hypothetical protein